MSEKELLNLMTTFGKMKLEDAKNTLARIGREKTEDRSMTAALAMMGILAGGANVHDNVVDLAIQHADNLIVALNSTPTASVPDKEGS